MKRTLLTLCFAGYCLLGFAQLDGKMRPGDRLNYNMGEQPGLEAVLIALAAGIGCLLVLGLGYLLIKKEDSKLCKVLGTIVGFAGLGGFMFFVLPCLLTWWFWLIFAAIAIPTIIGIWVYVKYKENQASKKPYCLDEGEYYFVNFARDDITHNEQEETPKAEFKPVLYSVGKVFLKDGVYYVKICEDFIQLEPNPYYHDVEAGIYGTKTHRFKKIYPTHFCNVYLNIPEQSTSVAHNQ